MKYALCLIALSTTLPALAEDTRQLDAHEHGVGKLNIAIEKSTITIEFHAPGADIVGFEYEAKSDADLAAIASATANVAGMIPPHVSPEAAGLLEPTPFSMASGTTRASAEAASNSVTGKKAKIWMRTFAEQIQQRSALEMTPSGVTQSTNCMVSTAGRARPGMATTQATPSGHGSRSSRTG